MILTIILLPLISFLLVAFLARFIGRQGSVLLTIIIMFVNIILTVMMSYNINFYQKWLFIKAGTWMYSDLLQIDWGFYIDNLTLTMLFVVNIISGLVHLYSADYMAHDPHLPRFMSYLSLFTFFMLVLVTGDNLVVLFVGWEGVGLCSYLLINFWYTRIQANKAAIKALIVNRVADFALMLGLAAIFFVFKSLDVHIIFSLVPFFLNSTINFLNFNFPVLNVICSLLFIGAMGKSAQIGLHTWLPDAMEGPTPVSALIHAATMVTAGVFLIIKCSPLFEYVPTVLSLVTFIGATTAFFSASIGLVQNDIKKVIAYSTCSQLGYMIFACGLSMYNVSLFHLANHAFFKALLFLSAGAIIHSVSNEQDMRKFGALASILPFTTIMFFIGSLSLTGFPFLTGFYSKDLILELALTKYTVEGSFAYTLGLVTAFFTSFYSFRVFYLTFIYKTNGFRHPITLAHELPWKMAISLSVLSLGSIFVGYLTKDLFVGLGTDFWNSSILILPEHNNQLSAEFFGLPGLYMEEEKSFWNSTYNLRWVKLLPFFFSLLALFLTYIFFYHISWNFLKKNNVAPILSEPFFFNIDLQKSDAKLISKIDFPVNSIFSGDLTFPEFEDLINLYTPTGFSEVYEETAIFYLPYEVDDPLTPSSEIINNKKYYFYQKLLWDLEQGQIGYVGMPIEAFDSFEKLYLVHQFLNIKPEINSKIKKYIREVYFFLTHKWYFDEIYNEYINRPLLIISYDVIFRFLDKGIFEIFGPYGISSTLFWAAKKIKKFHSGRVYYYAYFMFLMLLILLNSKIIFF